jgi:mannose-6-phosphate isomerase-like protein (cupin superfamily)
MSQRTDITEKNECFISEPQDEQFRFDMDLSKPGRTLITIPLGSKWRPKPHWHERYDEFFAVKQGRALYKIDGIEKIVTPEDGVQSVKVGQVHDFMRADLGVRGERGDPEDVVMENGQIPKTVSSKSSSATYSASSKTQNPIGRSIPQSKLFSL